MEKQPSYFQRDMGASQLVDPVPQEPELLGEPLVPNGKEGAEGPVPERCAQEQEPSPTLLRAPHRDEA